jgi:hypothetical protein
MSDTIKVNGSGNNLGLYPHFEVALVAGNEKLLCQRLIHFHVFLPVVLFPET